jgi:hypothetical protein
MAEYCCEQMAAQISHKCEMHSDSFECPDHLIHHSNSGAYGLVIHDGSGSFFEINFCPWCGTRLCNSQSTVDSARTIGLEAAKLTRLVFTINMARGTEDFAASIHELTTTVLSAINQAATSLCHAPTAVYHGIIYPGRNEEKE